jgi:hypothetical protein
LIQVPTVVGTDKSHPNPAIKRLDHLICQVPDIERYHGYLCHELGFPQAWAIGRFWPNGLTCGIGIGGINLELIQPDSGAPSVPICDTFVFEPTNLELAIEALTAQDVRAETVEKLESDSRLLALRGFAGTQLESPQLICRNVFPAPEFPFPMFFCEYSPHLKRVMAGQLREPTPFGRVTKIEVQLPQANQVNRIAQLGYAGDIEIAQIDDLGDPSVVSIHFEDAAGVEPFLPLGFQVT